MRSSPLGACHNTFLIEVKPSEWSDWELLAEACHNTFLIEVKLCSPAQSGLAENAKACHNTFLIEVKLG